MARHVNQVAGVVVSAAALAAVGVAAASAAPPTRPASSGGTVTGRLLVEGGPVNPWTGQQPGKRPIPGTIRFISTGRGTLTTQAWAAPGPLPPGCPPGPTAFPSGHRGSWK